MDSPQDQRSLPSFAPAALVLAGLALAAHLLATGFGPYEFHRDEFLYLSMGRHLRLFQMDFPPLMALLARGVSGLGLDSLFGFRLVPALAGTALVLLAVATARQLGGGRTAQMLTAVAVVFNPLFLRAASLFQPVVLDQVWWLLGCYALVGLERTGRPRWWLLLGLAGGLGLLCKFSILFFGAAVLAALLLTSRRRDLLGPWPWTALAMALLVGAPSVIGQITLGFPVLDQMAGLTQGQLARISLAEYLSDQLLWGPVSALLALAGAVALFRHRSLRPYRIVGWVTVAAFLLYAVTKGKSYYVGPIYPVLFAAGAVAIERLQRPSIRNTLAWAVGGLILLYGVATVPFGLPILSPEPMARYAGALGIGASVRTNRGEQLELPQDYADMLGWREKAEAVAEVYRRLPEAEQREVVLYGRNYGQAGALEYYGGKTGLPPVVSLAGSFYLFGPGTRPGRILILLGVERDELTDLKCATLEEAGRVRNRWGVPEERDVPIMLCRFPTLTLPQVWARERPHWG